MSLVSLQDNDDVYRPFIRIVLAQFSVRVLEVLSTFFERAMIHLNRNGVSYLLSGG